MKKLLLLILVGCSFFMNAQNLDNIWAKSLASTSTNSIVEISHTPDGKTIYVTQYKGTVDANPGTGVSNVSTTAATSFYLTCFDQNGNFLFSGGAGGNGTHVVNDILVDGNYVYVVGEFTGSLMFNGNGWSQNASTYTGFIVKYAIEPQFSQFTYQWAFTIGELNTGADGIKGISKGKFGNTEAIWLTGNFATTTNFNPSVVPATNLTSAGLTDAFIAAYTTNGGILFAKAIGGAQTDRGMDIASDSSNVVVIGDFQSTVNFGTVANPITYSTTAYASFDVFVTKYSSADGSVLWAKRINTLLDDYSKSISIDTAFNVYATGTFKGAADFDTAPTTFTASSYNGTDDVFTIKYDKDGAVQWVNRFGGNTADEVNKIVVEPNGNHIITGSYGLLATLNNTTTTSPVPFLSSGVRSAYFLRFDAQGALWYARNLPGTGNNAGRALDVTPVGAVYVGGIFAKNASFNLNTGGAPTLTVAGTYSTNTNGFIAKYYNCPSLTLTAIGDTVCYGDTIRLGASGGFNQYNWAGPINYTSVLQNPKRPNSTNAMNGTYTLSVADINGCSTTATTSVLVNLLPGSAQLAGSNPMGVCAGSSGTITSIGTPAYMALTWYDASNLSQALGTGTMFVTPPVVNTATYNAYTTNIISGCSSTVAAVKVVTVTPIPNQPNIDFSGSTLSICNGEYGTISTVSGVYCYWYTVPSGGTSITYASTYYTPTLTNTTTYYGENSNGYCASPRTAVTVTVSTCTGLNDEMDKSNINLYPNPATGYFVVSGIETKTEVKIIDVTGKVVYSEILEKDNSVITTEKMTSGIYIIEFENNGVSARRKLIIARP